MTRTTTSVFTLALALAAATSASAECAWVLWLGQRDRAVVWDAFQSVSECESAAEKTRREFKGAPVELKCLPDTMDPLGPKGGVR